MRVIIFTVCKHATVQNGVLSITSAFTNLLLQTLPARARFTIASRLFFTAQEQGRFKGRLKLINPDAQILADAPIEFDVSVPQMEETGVFADSVGEMEITFKTAGEHQFHLEAPGQDSIVIPFFVAAKKSAIQF